jgi:hypothetical protein
MPTNPADRLTAIEARLARLRREEPLLDVADFEWLLAELRTLQQDQADWRKGVAFIASALGDPADNLSCVRIGEIALSLRVRLEKAEVQLAALTAEREPET